MLAGLPAQAEQLLYSIDIPDAEVATYRVPIEIIHPGEVLVEATWTGNRPLAFRMEPPAGAGATVRRSSPSPMRMKLEVTEDQLGKGHWMLVIHANPLSGQSDGQVTVQLPEPAPLEPGRVMHDGAPERPLEPWERPRPLADAITPDHRVLIRSTESFRQLLIEVDRAPDTCRWQDGLLQWLVERRDLALDEGAEPAPATGKLMEQLAEAIRSVDEIRTTRDPVVVGPPPTNVRAWQRKRNDRLRRLEDRLDELLSAVARNHAPELEGRDWPMRLVSCLTAAERYFDQRWILGEDRAPNRDLAEDQWQAMNRAAAALDALAALADEDVIRLRARRP
jgi:hypothetical protein